MIAASLAIPEFFASANQKLHNANNIKKPFTRLNVLRVIRAVCDATEDQGGLIKIYGLYEVVQGLAEKDPSVLVREVAEQLVSSADTRRATPTRLRPVSGGRSSGLANISTPPTPHKTKGSYSQPPTPRIVSRKPSAGSFIFDPVSLNNPILLDSRPSTSHSSASSLSRPLPSFRPTSRDGNSGGSTGSLYSNTSAGSSSSLKSLTQTPGHSSSQQQSRLPRTRLSLARSKTENNTPTSSLAAMAETSPVTPTGTPQPRFVVKKRRETSASMSKSKSLVREKMLEEQQKSTDRRGHV